MAKHMTDSSSTPTHEQIARRAYEIFIERGQPAGQDLAHWLEAERQLRAAGQKQEQVRTAAPTAAAPQLPAANTPLRTPQGNGRSQSNGRTPSRATARK
jgi:hypothetical protein